MALRGESKTSVAQLSAQSTSFLLGSAGAASGVPNDAQISAASIARGLVFEIAALRKGLGAADDDILPQTKSVLDQFEDDRLTDTSAALKALVSSLAFEFAEVASQAADDRLLYLLVDGTRPMTGAIQLANIADPSVVEGRLWLAIGKKELRYYDDTAGKSH